MVNGPLGQALDAHLTAQEKLGLHGTALVAKGNDVLLHKGYGFANRQKRRRNTTETIFDIGSITKQFTATAIMKLESQGKLSTEDRLSKHFANVPPDKSAITLHHLLNHTSGFDDAYGEDTEIAPRDETVRLIMSKPLLSTPGIQYRYSNPGYRCRGVRTALELRGTVLPRSRSPRFLSLFVRDRAHLKRHHRPASMAVAPCLIRLTLRLQSISKTLLHDLPLVTAIRVRLDFA